ncbi:MAG: glycosyltransferase family 39 protein [Acidobacteriia bacterium]|nr:glycosyltransferase family 39 protein [Terriglobia bacterium]
MRTLPANYGWLSDLNSSFRKHSDLLAASLVAVGLLWRLWRAQATFLNTDEAWHFAVANQNSFSAAYRGSLTLAHPPLLVFILYFWKSLGTSNLMLRLPGVLAGTGFCWVFYKWLVRVAGHAAALAGLIFACFLPPMITLSVELRQYSFMLMFAVASAYFLEVALAENSVTAMSFSCASLYFAMLSHYSAFLFAAALGIYAIARMWAQRPRMALVGSWILGQAVGLGIAAALYSTQISRLSAVYPVAQPLQRFGDFYLSDWYFHEGRDRLLVFLYRGTFGVFRFLFGQTGIGRSQRSCSWRVC